MNGIHDMGGMHGFGPIEREEDEPVFHAPWERRILGMTLTSGVFSRYAIESIDPARYLSSSYYERWMLALEQGLLDKGLLSADELDERTDFYREHPDAALPQHIDPDAKERALKLIYRQRASHRDAGRGPRFRVGDQVHARNMHPRGHTRLPRYVRGKRGVVDRFHAVFDFQDTATEGAEAAPQAVYSVRFEARELWGVSAEANESIYVDMWESYLEPA